MFSRQHRKARVLFGLSDVLLTALAFEAAYQTRIWLHLGRVFFLIVPVKALALGFSLATWIIIGLWLGVYDKLDSGDPRIILRDTSRQCGYGIVCLVIFEYLMRLDVSRPFMMLFAVYSWILLLVFRLTAGRLVGVVRREFGATHHVMLVGLGERARRLGEALERNQGIPGRRSVARPRDTTRRGVSGVSPGGIGWIAAAARHRRNHLRGG